MKAETERLLSNLAKNKKSIEKIIFYSFLFFLPTQFGRHFWPAFSFINGLRIDYLSPTVYITDVLIFSLFVISFTKVLNKRSIKFKSLFFFSLALLFVGGVFSKNQYSLAYGTLKFLEISFLIFYISKLNFRKEVLKVSIIFSFGIISESVLSVLQYVNQKSIGGIFYFFGERTFSAQTPGIANASVGGQLFLRPYGTFSHPNVLAGFLVVSMAIFVFTLRNIKTKKTIKILLYFSILSGSFSLILTMSRIPIILWSVVLILIGLKEFKAKEKLRAGVFFLILAVIIIGVISTSLGGRIIETSIGDESFFQRIDLLKSSALMFRNSPLFGVGLNNFLTNLPFYGVSKGNIFLIQPVHNIYFLILSETGLAGLLLFFVLIKRALSFAIKKNFLLPLFCILFLGIFDHYFLTLQQGQLLFATVLGFCFTGFKKD